MSFRHAIAASALIALAGSFLTTLGCADDECSKASEHYTECIPLSSLELTPATTLRCEKEYLCVSRCVNTSDCEDLKDAFAAKPRADNRYLDCKNKCTQAEASP